MMNENRIIETLKYISKFVENRHDEGLGDYLHIVIGRTDINVIDETIYLLERKQKEIDREKQYSDLYEDLCNKQQKIIKELQKDKKVLIKNYDRVLGTFISKNKIRQKIKEVQETMCPNCCACGLCDEFKELLEGK